MKLPISLEQTKEWTLVGPMGPELPTNLVSRAIMAVDGGARFCPRIDVWIGDADSYTESIKCEHIYQFPPKKSASDLSLALTLFETTGPVVLHFWGFLGGRRDHEILNFGEVLHFLEFSPGSTVIFYDHNNRIALKCLSQGDWALSYQGTFSLVTIKNTMIKLAGACLYPIEVETELTPLSSLGLSNEAAGDFTLINQGPIMIFFPELP